MIKNKNSQKDFNINNTAQMHDAVAWNKKGIDAKESGNYTFAVAAFSKSIELNPLDANTYFCRGESYVKLNDIDSAIEDYNKSIEIDPYNLISYFCRGVAYSTLGNLDKAIDDYSKMIELLPELAISYLKRGVAYDKIGNYQRAIEDYNEAIRQKPDYVDAYYNRALTYGGIKRYDLAIEDLSTCIQLKPDYADAYCNRGRACFIQGKGNLGYLDALKANALGNCELLDYVKQKLNNTTGLFGHLKLIENDNPHSDAVSKAEEK